jgi:hypothetical protein
MAHLLRFFLTQSQLFCSSPQLSPFPSAGHEILRLQISKQVLASDLCEETSSEIENHGEGQTDHELEGRLVHEYAVWGGRKIGTHRSFHLRYLQPAIEFRHEVGRSTKGNRLCSEQSIVQCRVLSQAFAERSSLDVTIRSTVATEECRLNGPGS